MAGTLMEKASLLMLGADSADLPSDPKIYPRIDVMVIRRWTTEAELTYTANVHITLPSHATVGQDSRILQDARKGQ